MWEWSALKEVHSVAEEAAERHTMKTQKTNPAMPSLETIRKVAFSGATIAHFLKHLLRHTRGKRFTIWSGLPAQRDRLSSILCIRARLNASTWNACRAVRLT